MKASMEICVLATVVAVGSAARADSGDAGNVTGQPQSGPEPAAVTAAAGPAQPAPAQNDHALFVGRWAVGYQGISSLPIAGPCCASDNGPLLETVSAPVVGVRHWIRNTLGVDAGIGIGVHSAPEQPSAYGFALHAGLPIVIGQGRHTVFEVTPEATLGVAFGDNPTALPPIGGSATVNGFMLRVGARAGAEVHFGFIGIPELALQASVGLYWLGEAYNLDVNGVRIGSHFMTLTTSVNGNPWDVFSESVAALYYF